MPEVQTTLFLEGLTPAWRECVTLAWEAHCSGSLPIAAVVVDENSVIVARGRNRVAREVNGFPHVNGTPYIGGVPIAHAEVNALLEMGYRPEGARPTLYTTTEPCPLCMGAARMAGVGHVVYASRDPWAGCAVMAEDIPYLRRMGPSVAGPDARLEDPLLAWQVAWHLTGSTSHGHPFFEAMRALQPHAFEVGRMLWEAGQLRELANRKAPVEEAWSAILAAFLTSDQA